MSSSNSQFSDAWSGIETGWQNGQLAHAYILQGAPHGAALRFAEKLLNLIFNSHPQVQAHTHPDIVWIEPQSKSRQIVIDEIRELIRKLAQTSFAGGWKAGVILAAGDVVLEFGATPGAELGVGWGRRVTVWTSHRGERW